MDDDFNTRVAIVEIQSVVKYLREKLDSDSDKEISSAVSWLSEFAGDVLGILPDDEEIMVNIEKIEGERMRLQDQVTDLLSQRKIARQNKDWGKADLIRNQLNEIGVIVEDSPKGPVWKLK
jgi:cysteinyl-tRNA synthetase